MLWPALIVPLPALIVPLPCLVAITPLSANRFPYKVAPNLPNKIPKTLLFVILLHF